MAKDKELEPGLVRLLDARDAGDHDLLLAALRDDPEYAATAARILAHLGEQRAVPMLVDHLASDRAGMRLAAVRALARLGAPPEARGRLVATALADPLPSAREWAAVAVAGYADPDAAQLLLGLLADPLPSVRLGAARGLAAIGDPGFREPLQLARPRFLREPVRWLSHAHAWRLLLLELDAKAAAAELRAAGGPDAGPAAPPAP